MNNFSNFKFVNRPIWTSYDPADGEPVGYVVSIGNLQGEENGEFFKDRNSAVLEAKRMCEIHHDITIYHIFSPETIVTIGKRAQADKMSIVDQIVPIGSKWLTGSKEASSLKVGDDFVWRNVWYTVTSIEVSHA